ncbi:MAG: autotransporter adhesin family protein [Oscillospiraceae bacterium]|nr:autotransporter adhesin family protein [Oscillospiraceae bacterium]
MKLKKRILSIFLILSLLLTLVPTAALAEGIELVPLSTPVSTATQLREAIALGGTQVIELANDIVDSLPIPFIPPGVNITLTSGPGGPFSLVRAAPTRHFAVDGGTLTLENVTIDGGGSNSHGGGIAVQNGGSLYLNYGGTITGNRLPIGGGVFIGLGSTFTMNDGLIYDNAGVTHGGGVGAIGTFIMNGGTISGNTSVQGGGVLVNGQFIMNNGTISDNTATQGGGVAVQEALFGATFIMHNGTITRNKAIGRNMFTGTDDMAGGGGVFVLTGGEGIITFTILLALTTWPAAAVCSCSRGEKA